MTAYGGQENLLTSPDYSCYILFKMITEANNNAQEVVEFLTVQEVMTYLGVSESTVYRYINRYQRPLPVMRISSRKILVKKVDLENWLEEARKVAY